MLIEVGEKTKIEMSKLGIPKYPFTVDELKKSFRLQSIVHHPDKGGNEEKFKEINSAYKYLLNFAYAENSDAKKIHKFEKLIPGYVWTKCKECSGEGRIHLEGGINIIDCKKCNGLGDIVLKCKFCSDGKHKQKNGIEIICRSCNGSGVFKKVCCDICNTKEMREMRKRNYNSFFYMYDVLPKGKIKINETSRIIKCELCKGTGEIQEQQINPVLKSGSIKL